VKTKNNFVFPGKRAGRREPETGGFAPLNDNLTKKEPV
jgi:hypothetical protein